MGLLSRKGGMRKIEEELFFSLQDSLNAAGRINNTEQSNFPLIFGHCMLGRPEQGEIVQWVSTLWC